jgi:hypothetical protein
MYVGLFILAVGRHDRQEYAARLWELTGRSHLVPAA